MSLTSAMNSAVSGLTAVSRATSLIADNVANAATPGYGRRTLALSAYGNGLSGVRVMGVVRHSNPVLVSQRRSADAQLALADGRTAFFSRITSQVGGPGDPYSLTARLADFETSLITAASRPDLADRLNDSVHQAGELAEVLRNTSDDIQAQRRDADRSIAVLVTELNTGLARLQEINAHITGTISSGGDPSGLYDQRQLLVDDINKIVPVTVVERQHGQIALYSDGGAILLDGPAATIGFSASTDVQPHMTVDDGNLSGLTINGVEVRTGSTNGALRGGSLGAEFAIRDEWAIDAQAGVDAIARDLIERFEDPAVDPTRTAGSAGLFTDNGNALDPADETGLAGRIRINALVDPAQGGASWRLRDGLGAAAPGDAGNASLINDLAQALAQPRLLASGDFGTGSHSAASATTALVSGLQFDLATAQDAQSYASAAQSELMYAELAQGVDTDAEMQSLIVLEQRYVANAKVLETIDSLLAELMRI